MPHTVEVVSSNFKRGGAELKFCVVDLDSTSPKLSVDKNELKLEGDI